MKVVYSTIFCLLCLICKAQQIPITANTYENYTNIDNYFREIDSLLLLNGINKMTVYNITDTQVQYQVVNYANGKRVKVHDFNQKTGKPERTITYTYGKNKLDAELVHYPSEENFNIFPARQYDYLVRLKEGNQFTHPYIWDDTITHIVRMYIRHTWKKDGSVLFEGFDKEGKLIDTYLMTPTVTWEEYQRRKSTVFPQTIVNESDEYQYNEKGQLLEYRNKSINRKRVFSYDERGLLVKIVVFDNEKQVLEQLYKYE